MRMTVLQLLNACLIWGCDMDAASSINVVLDAVDAVSLFGNNAKRADIYHRRLLRDVHPDRTSDPRAEEATARLNELWSNYQQRSASKSSGSASDSKPSRSSTMVALARTESVVVFAETSAVWLTVRRSTITSPTLADLSELTDILHDTPVIVADIDKRTTIRQSDGDHVAWRSKPLAKRIWSFDDLAAVHVKPENQAWLIKRVLFLGAALDKANLSLRLHDTVVYENGDHAGHGLVIVDPYAIDAASGGGAIQSLCDELLHCNLVVDSVLSRFVRGCTVKSLPSSDELLRDYDDVLCDRFGLPRYSVLAL